jgi:hypothetical protein
MHTYILVHYKKFMSLINEVQKLCNRLAPHGWHELLLEHGLDIKAVDLENELLKELPKINRKIPGFQDFASEGKRGIEPRKPAYSLLFHALSSHNLINGANGKELARFPTLAEIDTVENFVYGVRPPSINDLNAIGKELSSQSNDGAMAIVVFASEYRPGPESVHRKHADVCFSRTGVARVGTAEAFYDDRRRGFLPFDENDNHAIRVLPARYSAYVAIQLAGNKEVFGPLRFNARDENDGIRKFWVPLHKLFEGPECIKGLNLNLILRVHHINEKIRRVHLELKKLTRDLDNKDIEKPPFKFTTGIAELSTDPSFGFGLLVPEVHPALVEAAVFRGKPLSFLVPPESELFESSFYIPASGGPRHAPEFVHVRHEVLADGTIRDLNESSDVVKTIRKGGYRAQHYIDFTGDGWVEVSCPELATDLPRPPIPAYSLVTAPDFYPNCDQGELYEWWLEKVPKALRERLWFQGKPYTLSDTRLAPNLELQQEGANFRSEDETVTAIVSLPSIGPVEKRPLEVPETLRHTYLPDGASGEFAPGWDVSYDHSRNVDHLAAYGLGSPFPEDSKLCAALATFWPAVAPDAGRSFYRTYPTVSPLTDEEIGQVGNLPWDGTAGPKIRKIRGMTFVEYYKNAYVDYVQNSLQKKFTLTLTGKVSTDKYKSRILAMARAYQSSGIFNTPLGDNAEKAKLEWPVLSFSEISANNAELKEAQVQSGHTLHGELYRIEIYHKGGAREHESDNKKILVEMHERITILVGSLPDVLVKRDEGAWRSINTV